MIKRVLLAGAMTIAVPTLAQNSPQQAQSQSMVPSIQPAAPDASSQSGTQGQTATPSAADPSTAQASPQTLPTDSTAAQPAQTASQPTASGEQVASVVDQQFATYDKNGDGKLSKAEFGDWMTALKKASDPSAKPDAAYNAAAFAQADKDKSATVTKSEAEKFLNAGKS